MKGTRAVVAIAVAVGTATILPGFLIGGLSVQIRRDLDLEISAIGQATGTFFLAAALGSAPGGALAERIGAAAAMRAAALASAVSLAAVALVVHSLPALLAALVVGGFGNALAQPAINLYIAERAAEDRRGLAFGFKQAAIPSAVLFSGLSVPLLALTLGWRWAYALGALAALGAMAMVRGARRGAAPRRAAGGRLRARGPLRQLAFSAVLASAGPNALGAYLATTAVAAGLGEGGAGALLAVGSAVSIGVRVLAGWLADRAASHRLTPMVAMLAAGALGFGLLSVSDAVPVVVGAVIAFGMGWGWPGLFNLSIVSRHIEAPAAASGITQTGIYVGAAAGPFAFGLLTAAASLTAAWAATAAIALAAAALAALAERRYRSLEGTPSTLRALPS